MEHHYSGRYLASGSGSAQPSKSIRDVVWKRDEGLCIYCGSPAQVLDHVIPWGQNGPSISSNLVCSCNKCNIYKGRHPRGLKHLTRAIFWLITHHEDTTWMNDFYPSIESKLKRGGQGKSARETVRIKYTTPYEEPHEKAPRQKKQSLKTKAIATRLPNDVYAVIERRAKKRNMKVSEWLKGFVTYDARRRR